MTRTGKVDIDGNKMRYEYILWVTKTWMGQFHTYNLICCKEDKEVIEIIICVQSLGEHMYDDANERD